MFGIGKAIKKGWKKAFGWADDPLAKSIFTGVALGALTGGIGSWAVGALGSAVSGAAAGTAAAGTAAGAGAAAGAAGAAGASWGSGAILGGVLGGAQGVSTGLQMQQQEKMLQAQIASQEKIAAMQNAPVVQSAVAPTATTQNASIDEQNAATSKRRALSFAKTTRGSIGRRLTLG